MMFFIVLTYVCVGLMVFIYAHTHKSNDSSQASVRLIVALLVAVFWLPSMLFMYFMEVAER
jgi:hypothetical protein